MNVKKAKALIEIGASTADLDRDLAAARKKWRTFQKDVSKLGGKALGGAKALGSSLLGGLGIQAAGGLVGMVSGVFDLERGLVRFQIAAGKSNAEMAEMRKQILDVSKETGVSSDEVLAGAQTYVDLTGDVKGATHAMRIFARIAQASGSSVSDVSTAAAALQQSMQLDPEDIEKVFSGLISQGKAGAVSLKDFAAELSSLAPRFAKFGGSGLMGIADLGSAFQVVRQGFGSASEAATGLEAIMGALSLNADKFTRAGVKIFNVSKDGKKTFRGFVDIIDSIGHSKLMRDPQALQKAMGSKEAAQAFDMLTKNRDLLEQLYQEGLKTDTVQQDLNTYMQSSAGKVDAAWQKVKASLAEAFTPEKIEALANALSKAADYFGKLIGYMDEAVHFIAEDLGTGDEDRTRMARNVIQGKDDFATRSMVNAFESKTGVKLGGTPQERAQTLAAHADEFDLLGANNIRTAADAELNGGQFAQAARKVRADVSGQAQPVIQVNINEQRLGGIMGEVIAKTPIIIKIDGSVAAKSVNNAPAQRRQPGGV